jgi:hypothetical protein
MRHFLSLLLLVLGLLFSAAADAGILVSKHNSSTIALASRSGLRETKALKTSLSLHRPAASRCRRGSSGLGLITIGAAIAGFFIPAFSILAILLGILGMTRGCRADRLAEVGMVFGLAEFVVFLLTTAAVYSLL